MIIAALGDITLAMQESDELWKQVILLHCYCVYSIAFGNGKITVL